MPPQARPHPHHSAASRQRTAPTTTPPAALQRALAWVTLWLCVLTIAVAAAACGDGFEDSGGAASDTGGCSSDIDCSLGFVCAPSFGECVPDSSNGNTSTNSGATSTNNSTAGTNNGTTGTNNATTGTNNSDRGWRYVLVEDLTPESEGESPGADIDAIGLRPASAGNDREVFVTTVDDFQIGGGERNKWRDPQAVLGAPDSDCERQGFVSLGGKPEDGYLIVGFSTVEEEIQIRSGDVVVIYELGATSCPDSPDWQDDPFAVSVSLSDDRTTFEEVAAGATGLSSITIP